MSKVRLFFAGDFCSKPSTTMITVSDDLKALVKSCDLKVVNFEVPLKPKDVTLQRQSRERFFQHDDAPVFLRELGFNLFQLANNHIFDWGEEGFKKTKGILGDDAFGAGTYDEAYCVKVVEIAGVRIGFMALCFAAYKGVFNDVLNHDGLGCAYVNDLRVNHDIVEAKRNVDYLFILPHDGIEYIEVPMPETIARYHDFIDFGADGVIASHPHCPQGWEEYNGKPVFYSLGNFLFNSKEGYDYRVTNRPHWYDGLCVMMSIDDGRLSYEVVNTRNINNTQIVVDTEDSRQEYNQYLCDILHNDTDYRIVLLNECRRLAKTHELPIIDRSFHDYGLKSTIESFVKYTIKRVFGIRRSHSEDGELAFLIKNDMRRCLLSRHLEGLNY